MSPSPRGLPWPLFFLNFWLHHAACKILVPQPRMQSAPPAVEAQSLNHWTAREVPPWSLLSRYPLYFFSIAHSLTWDIIFHFSLVFVIYIKFQLCKGRDFCIFCSLLYLQHLEQGQTHVRYCVNICWMNEQIFLSWGLHSLLPPA